MIPTSSRKPNSDGEARRTPGRVAAIGLLLISAVPPGCSDKAPPAAASPRDSTTIGDATETAKTASPDGHVEMPAQSATAADSWGDLTGQFFFDGDPPERKSINVTTDAEFCSQHDLQNEKIVVAADGSLANVVVYLLVEKGTQIDVHPDYEATASGQVVLDNNGCRFDPHVLLVRTSQTLSIKNSDPVPHNVNAMVFKNPSFNELVPPGGTVIKNLASAEARPAGIGCGIHPWMSGYLVIRDNPYMAVSGADGHFTIEDLPVGDHEIQLWHETSGYVRGITLNGHQVSKKGRVTLTIRPGTNDLGQIRVPGELFAK